MVKNHHIGNKKIRRILSFDDVEFKKMFNEEKETIIKKNEPHNKVYKESKKQKCSKN